MRKDGVLVGCVFTKDTLFELRSSLQIAEMERQGASIDRTIDILYIFSS